MRDTVYIAGPYAAETPELIAQNIERAERLGRFAVAQGLAPIVPHTLGASGLYGSPTEQDDGTSRRLALECSEALAAGCDRFWVILRDDRTMSAGCQREFKAWRGGLMVERTWAEWLEVGV